MSVPELKVAGDQLAQAAEDMLARDRLIEVQANELEQRARKIEALEQKIETLKEGRRSVRHLAGILRDNVAQLTQFVPED